MRIRLLSVVMIVCVAPLAAPAQEKMENPYKNAKIGDYVGYKMTTSAAGKDFEMSMKQTVSAKSDTEVTLKTDVMFMGNALPSMDTKIDLTKPFNFADAVTKGKTKGKFEKTGEGKEKIKVGDKTYDCTWITGKVAAEAKGMKIDSDVKVWMSKSVPMSGMVKLEMKSTQFNVSMEITESGSK